MVRTKRWKFTLWKYSNVGQPELSQQSLGNFPLVQEMCTIPELGGSGRKRRGMEQEGFFFFSSYFRVTFSIHYRNYSLKTRSSHTCDAIQGQTYMALSLYGICSYPPPHSWKQAVCLKGNQIKPNQIKFSIFLEGISNSFLKSLNFLSLAFKPIQ